VGMLAAAVVVFAGALLLLAIAWKRRNREGLPAVGKDEGVSTGLVVAFGIVIPVVCLVTLFFISDIGVVKATSAPKPGQTKLNITVIGHQWFWEVRYPGTTAVTANEIHIPAQTNVGVTLRSVDVIHSFWVPELNKKVDTIPGHPNRMELYADHPGVYRGQCAEFCGLQHANMSPAVYADPPAKFRAWLANESRPLAPPAPGEARAEEGVFMTQQCASCHNDPRHRGARDDRTRPHAPGLAPHARRADDPHTIAPTSSTGWPTRNGSSRANRMPGLNLSGQQLRQVVTFLEGGSGR